MEGIGSGSSSKTFSPGSFETFSPGPPVGTTKRVTACYLQGKNI
jgi:hypothetical protein